MLDSQIYRGNFDLVIVAISSIKSTDGEGDVVMVKKST